MATEFRFIAELPTGYDERVRMRLTLDNQVIVVHPDHPPLVLQPDGQWMVIQPVMGSRRAVPY